MTQSNHNSIGHETDTGDVRAIGIKGGALATGIAVILLLVYGLFHYLVHHPVFVAPESPLADKNQPEFPPRPRIEEHPALELKELRTQEDSVLSSYGWVDKKAGVVRIPIERAMELQLERGFPVRKEMVKR